MRLSSGRPISQATSKYLFTVYLWNAPPWPQLYGFLKAFSGMANTASRLTKVDIMIAIVWPIHPSGWIGFNICKIFSNSFIIPTL